jgi:hypothetical protein
MKKILIDSVKELFGDNTSEFTVDVDGKPMKGWQIAKPLNYDKEYFSMKERKAMARAILEGKAIAVSFFEDLTPDEQSAYVEEQMRKNNVHGDQLLNNE